MFQPLECFIGLRYLRSRRRRGVVSFMSTASLLGIALGVAALIVILSVMNGFEVCRVLKSKRITEKIPILLLLARANENLAIEDRDCGADDVLAKPFGMREISLRVDLLRELHELRSKNKRPTRSSR